MTNTPKGDLSDFDKKFLESKGIDLDNLPDKDDEETEIDTETDEIVSDDTSLEPNDDDEGIEPDSIDDEEDVEVEEYSDDEDVENDVDSIDEEDVEKTEPKSEKQHKAFERLRKQGNEHKQNADRFKAEAEESNKALQDLATMQGYHSVQAFLDAVKAKKAEKEAERQGVSPEVYNEMQTLREKVNAMESEKTRVKAQQAQDKFRESFENLVRTYNLTDSQKTNVLEELGKDGYDANSIIGVKNHTRLLKGYLPDDVVAESKRQAQLESAKKAKGSGVRKIKSNTSKKKLTARDIAMRDIKSLDSH